MISIRGVMAAGIVAAAAFLSACASAPEPPATDQPDTAAPAAPSFAGMVSRTHATGMVGVAKIHTPVFVMTADETNRIIQLKRSGMGRAARYLGWPSEHFESEDVRTGIPY